MNFKWQDTFTKVPEFTWKDNYTLERPFSISTLENLKRFLNFVHIKFCLMRYFCEQSNYPLVTPQELLPSFESNLYEYVNLPGFSMVAFDRPLNYFQEIFQFDILHCVEDAVNISHGPASPLESVVIQQNYSTFLSRLPKLFQDEFKKEFEKQKITELKAYPKILPFLLQMDRGHVLAKNSSGEYYFSGIYASFPSDLDSELKRFGLRIGKFKPDDNLLYELNRNFVYQFLMELYGYPIASERRTSAALFARRLFKMGEDFLISVLGQSDRTITNLCSKPNNKRYPSVEKIALVSVEKHYKEQIKHLEDRGFIIRKNGIPAVILKVVYQQHKYDPNNIRKDRALSVLKQEAIHPLTGEVRQTNIIKDTNLMSLILNDIVKGEFYGRIKYKRNEIVENTETHAKRLKFLYAWLRKHQRRIIGYSDEFYSKISKVLDHYLLSKEHSEIFKELNPIFQEVWGRYKYIDQARKVKQLEDLKDKKYKGQKINNLEMLQYANKLVQDLLFEIVKYFDSLVLHAVHICEQILNDRYLIKKYIQCPADDLTEYGLRIRKLYGHLIKLVDELNAIRKARIKNKSYYNQYNQPEKIV